MTLNRHWAAMLVVVTAIAGTAIGTRARAEEDAAPIVVVTSRDVDPYDSVVHGIRRRLSDPVDGHALAVHSLDSGAQDAKQALRRARNAGDTPILTIGSRATRAALEAPGDGPVIACMVVDSRELRED